MKEPNASRGITYIWRKEKLVNKDVDINYNASSQKSYLLSWHKIQIWSLFFKFYSIFFPVNKIHINIVITFTMIYSHRPFLITHFKLANILLSNIPAISQNCNSRLVGLGRVGPDVTTRLCSKKLVAREICNFTVYVVIGCMSTYSHLWL